MLCCCGRQSGDGNTSISEESVRINALINASRDSTHLPGESLQAFLLKADDLAQNVTNDTLKLDHLSRISLAYKRLEDSLGFRKMNQKVLELSQKGRLYKAEGESHWDLASFLKSYGIMDSAYYHYQRAYRSFDQLPVDSTSQSLRGRMQYSMGSIQEYFKDYLGAEVSTTQALMIFEDLEDYKRIYNCNNLLGITANGMNNSEKSLEYYQKAKSYIPKLQLDNRMIYVWENQNNIANLLLKNRNYLGAEHAFRNLLKDVKLKTGDPIAYSMAMVSLARAIQKGKNQITESEKLLKKAIVINDSIGLIRDQPRAKKYYAELLASKLDTFSAIKVAKESREIAQQTSNNFQQLEVLKILTALDYKNAVVYSNEFYDLNEQIQEDERAKRDKFARIRLETDEVIQKNEALTRGKLIWTLIAIGFLLVAAALYIIFTQRASNNRLKYEQEQQEANQEIYSLMLAQQGKFEEGKKLTQKRVSEELHDSVLSEMLGIRLMLSGLNEYNDDDAMAQRADYIEKLKDLSEEIRTISHELSNASYQKFYNFIVSLDELISTVGASSGMQCSFSYEDDMEWDALDGDIKINAYRIVQESLQNCVKHAQARQVHISLVRENSTLKMAIMDDGIGFDKAKNKNGIGLRNLMSRVQKIDGVLEVDSAKGKGTTITVQLPIKYIVQKDPKAAQERKQILNA